MRFEVKAGGIVAILFGLALLSGAVFVMGLLAGYDVGHESQTDAQKVATEYPVEAPPSAAQTPAAIATRGLVEGPVPVAPGEPPAAPASLARKPVPAATGPALASNPPPPVQTTARPNQPGVTSAPAPVASRAAPPAEEPVASAETRSTVHDFTRKPFNIEIQAAMDSTSAGQMVRRLQALGYQPHMLPTQINGATWYKVEVGPYATQAEAAAAETELRQKYNSTYGHGGAPAQSADTDQSPEE